MTTSLTDSEEFGHEPWPQIWSGGMTVLWGLVIIGVWAFSQVIGAILGALGSPEFENLKEAFLNSKTEEVEALMTYGDIVWMSAFVSSIVGVLLVALVIRIKRGLSISEYLHLNSPSAKVWLKWVGIFILFGIALEFVARYIPGMETDFMEKVLANTSNLTMLTLTVGVFGPIFEEVFFRGFLFKGLEKSIGGHMTVISTAVIFALMHAGQYPLAVVAAIVPMGLVFGYARMYSGSLLIPIALHIINNLIATAAGIFEMGG